MFKNLYSEIIDNKNRLLQYSNNNIFFKLYQTLSIKNNLRKSIKKVNC